MIRRVSASDTTLPRRARARALGTALLVLAATLALTQLPPAASEAETRRAVDTVSAQAVPVQVFRQSARVRFVRGGRGEVGCTPTGSTSTWLCAPGVTLAATGNARLIVEQKPGDAPSPHGLRIFADTQARVVVRGRASRVQIRAQHAATVHLQGRVDESATIHASDDAFVALSAVTRLRGRVDGAALVDVYGAPAAVDVTRRQLGWLRILPGR